MDATHRMATSCGNAVGICLAFWLLRKRNCRDKTDCEEYYDDSQFAHSYHLFLAKPQFLDYISLFGFEQP